MDQPTTTQSLLFPDIFRKPVMAEFDERRGSSGSRKPLYRMGEALAERVIERHRSFIDCLQAVMQLSAAGDLWSDDECETVACDVAVQPEAACTGEPFRCSSPALTSLRIPWK